IKESDTGLAAPSQWDLVARCTKIINPNSEDAKYVINVKQIAKFVVGLGDKVSPTDIEEGMCVGFKFLLPPKIDPSVTMMMVEEKPDVTYNDVGGCKEQIEKMREFLCFIQRNLSSLELTLQREFFVIVPGTGKTLLARAVANMTDACFIRVIGSELVQKYVGEGARMVWELFLMARSKNACIVFFDEVDAIAGARFDDGVGGDNGVQRTMLEIVNQLDGFDARGNIKVLMATNRPDTLDPALLRPGRLTQIFKIHTRTMNCERDIRCELLARICPNSTGADIRSVCTEADIKQSDQGIPEAQCNSECNSARRKTINPLHRAVTVLTILFINGFSVQQNRAKSSFIFFHKINHQIHSSLFILLQLSHQHRHHYFSSSPIHFNQGCSGTEMRAVDAATAKCGCDGEDDVMPENISELPSAITGHIDNWELAGPVTFDLLPHYQMELIGRETCMLFL
ncbi:hypothetical protein S245_070113, partial [Arachis hypogaea]